MLSSVGVSTVIKTSRLLAHTSCLLWVISQWLFPHLKQGWVVHLKIQSVFIIYIAQEVINILKQPGLLMEWDPLVKDVSEVTMAATQDVISISFNCTSIIARTVHYLRECFGGEINAIYSRQVHLLFNGFWGVVDRHFSRERKIYMYLFWSKWNEGLSVLVFCFTSQYQYIVSGEW